MKTQIENYKKNGYLHLKGFLNKEQVENILIDAKNIFLRQFNQKGYTKERDIKKIINSDFNQYLFRLFQEDLECLSNCGKQAQHLISLHRLSLDNNIIEQLKKFDLKFPAISTRPVLYFNHPKLAKKKVFYKVDAHQDWRSMQGSLNSIIIWVPLMDIDKELGALELLPGSHLQGLRTDHFENGFGMVSLNESEVSKMTPVVVKVGDVLLFSSLLIHQSGENITDMPRWSCHFRYNDLDEPTFIQRKYAHPYIYKPIDELITPNFPLTEDIKNTFTI